MNAHVERLEAPFRSEDITQLADLMYQTIQEGAAIGFMQPFSRDDGVSFWRHLVEPQVQHRAAELFVLRQDHLICGTVQLLLDLPPNQPHRCEVAKMMVHPDYRRRGMGRALMQTVLARARSLNKSLITLDTRTGDHALPLYQSVGFCEAGIIPSFAFDPDGKAQHSTTYMYCHL